jgi:hypothetical protein
MLKARHYGVFQDNGSQKHILYASYEPFMHKGLGG